MPVNRNWMLFLSVCLSATAVYAQNAVQLPTYSYFGTGTVVSVPDRGRVYTGGVNRAASGRNEFGAPLLPLRNRSVGMERSASSVWTSVYIHDFEAMDEYLLGQAREASSGSLVSSSRAAETIASRGPVQPLPAAGDTWPANRASRVAQGPLAKSVAELQAERAGEQRARLAEAERLFERGRTAEASGKANVARIYYQQASRRAQGALKERILSQLARLSATPIAQR